MRRACAWAAAGLLMAIVAHAGAAHAQDTDEDPLAKAERAMQAARLDVAVDEFDAVLASSDASPDDADAETNVRLGRAQAGLGAVALARRDFEAAGGHFASARERFETARNDAWLGVVWYQTGALERARGDDEAAEEAFDEAVKTFEDVSSIDGERDLATRWEASAQMALGEIRQGRGDARGASDAFERASRLFRRVDAVLDEADALYAKGLAEHSRGEFRRAIRELDDALERYRRGGDDLWVAVTQTALGQVHFDAGAYEEAGGRFKTALSTLEFQKGAELYELAARHGNAQALVKLGEIEGAVQEFERAAELAASAERAEWRAAIDVGRGNAFMASGQAEKARERFEAVLEYANGESMLRQRGESLLSLGDVLMAAERYEDAQARYEQALELDAQLEDELFAASARLGRGEALLAQGSLSDAESALSAAVEALSRGAVAERARGLAALADVAALRGANDLAHDRFEAAIELFEQSRQPLRLGRAHVAEGKLYVTEDEFRRAERSFEDGIDALRLAGAPMELAAARLLYAATLDARGDEREAIDVFERAGRNFDDLEQPVRAGEAYLAVARLHVERRDEEDAVEFVDRAVERLDTPETGELALQAQLLRGEILLALERPEDALGAFERVGTLSEDQSADEHEARAALERGYIHLAADRYELAETAFEQAITIYSRLGSEEARADSLIGLGRVYLARDDRRALETFETAKRIYSELDLPKEGSARRWRRRARRAFDVPDD